MEPIPKAAKQKRPREDAPPPSSTPAAFVEPTFDLPPPGSENSAFIHPDRRPGGRPARGAAGESASGAAGEAVTPAGEDEPAALSHKEKRLAKRRKLAGIEEPAPLPSTSNPKSILSGPAIGNTPAKSAHGIWVGNMNFSTSNKMLLGWFEERGLKEVTRLNMPGGKRVGELNRGFAYLDFPTAQDVELAVSLSEQHLDGRKLLIKSSTDYTGRPSATSTTLPLASSLDPSSLVQPTSATTEETAQTLNKTARKILDRQRNPAGPTLFIGNLGFETKMEDIREMFDAHQRAAGEWAKKVKVVKEVKGKKGKKEDEDEDDKEAEDDDESEEEEEDDEEMDSDPADSDRDEDDEDDEEEDENEDLTTKKPKSMKKPEVEDKKSKFSKTKGPKEPKDLSQARDAGIRKIRLGTFEDTGKCKGWAFVDFHLPAQCTRALLNARNHMLDGRALVVEYASSEAVRRGQVGTKAAIAAGGGRGTGMRGGRGGSRGGRGGGEGDRGGGNGGGGKGKDWDDGDVRAYAGGAARKDYEDNYGGGEEKVEKAPRGEFGFRPSSSAPRGRGGADRGAGDRGGRGGRGRGEGPKDGVRAKPGAALASAQRASEAIVESTGRKITFG